MSNEAISDSLKHYNVTVYCARYFKFAFLFPDVYFS